VGDDEPRPHEDTVRYALARGAILVAASGNKAGHIDYYPAIQRGVIAVGSVDAHGHPSSFMSRGGHVALCAPGEGILGPAVSGYQRNTGTSFAAPFVTAACALMMARALRYSTPLSAELARRLLVKSAAPFGGGESGGCGAGILDVPAALAAVDEALLAPDDASSDAERTPRESIEAA
jgi:subtilisin family serine protease